MSILDHYEIEDDLRVELGREKTIPTDAWWEAGDYLKDQVVQAVASEGAQKPYAYREYLILAGLALQRAYRLCDCRQVPGKGDVP